MLGDQLTGGNLWSRLRGRVGGSFGRWARVGGVGGDALKKSGAVGQKGVLCGGLTEP